MPSKVLVAIQARSGSTRLPRKAFALIGEKRLLDHVIDSCLSAATYVNNEKWVEWCRVALLVPEGDPIATEFARRCPNIVEGSEYDVLSRFHTAKERFKPELIVRITGDCPMIPDFLIAKLVKIAAKNSYDYVSNVDEEVRTTIDGYDCEVMSSRMLEWLQNNAKEAPDREHVTLLARSDPPSWAKLGFVINYQDQSDMKISVDTQEDLERVRQAYERRDLKNFKAERKFGRQSVHRL